MDNGGNELIETFRRIVERQDDLPQEATNELILAAIVDSRQAQRRMATKLDQVSNDLRDVRENDIPHLALKLDQVDKRYRENPSLLWLLRFKTKKTSAILTTIAIVILNISIIGSIIVNSIPEVRDWFLNLLGLPIP